MESDLTAARELRFTSDAAPAGTKTGLAADGWSGCGWVTALRVPGGDRPVRALRLVSGRTAPTHVVPCGPRLTCLCCCLFWLVFVPRSGAAE